MPGVRAARTRMQNCIFTRESRTHDSCINREKDILPAQQFYCPGDKRGAIGSFFFSSFFRACIFIRALEVHAFRLSRAYRRACLSPRRAPPRRSAVGKIFTRARNGSDNILSLRG